MPKKTVIYHGLVNQGATCYLNSVLQILFMTTEIHDRLDVKAHVTDHELKNLFEGLKEKICGTEGITKTLGITNVYQQRDAALCLGEILHKVSPKVSEVFQGQLNDSTICCGCKSIIKEVKPFLILPLSPKDSTNRNYNVEGGFEEIFKDESLSGDNMVYCDKCNKKTEAMSTCQMVEYPRILILVLERFDMDYSTMRYVTSDRCVEIPESLQRENETFKLYGMVNHMGGLRGGHYTATILSEEDHTWYEFNDHQVEQTKEQPFPNNRPYCSRTAYLLFYRGGANSASILMKPLSILKKPLSILKKPLSILKKPLIAVIVVGGFALTVVLIKTQYLSFRRISFSTVTGSEV